MAIKIIVLSITGIVLLAVFFVCGTVAAIGAVAKYMKERDSKHESWIDPRNDRTY